MSGPRSRLTPPTPTVPRVSIILLTFNAPDWTAECLKSLFLHTPIPYELIIVDNASGSETRDVLLAYEAEPGVRLVFNEENVGYAAGNNQGYRLAAAEIILFLNNDVVVTEGWLDNIVTVFDSNPAIGAVGPRSNHASGIQGGIFLDSLTPESISRFARHFNWHDPLRWHRVETLSGFVLAVRRTALEEVGLFDEGFEIGTSEDRELCDRIRNAGYQLVCAGDTFVFHAGHASFLANRINFAHRQNLNRLRYLEKAGSRGSLGDSRRVGGALPVDGTIITLDVGAKYALRDGMLSPISQMAAVDLLSEAVDPQIRSSTILDEYPIGDPILFIRAESHHVYLYAFGVRHPLVGSRDRISQLRGITVMRDEELERIPLGGDRPIQSIAHHEPFGVTGRSPIDRFEDRFLGTPRVERMVDDAIRREQGLSLVRLGSGEALLLNGGLFSASGFNLDYSGARSGDESQRTQLLDAIRSADIVGITPERGVEYCAPLLEKLFSHFNVAPRAICSAFINWDLIDVDRDVGRRNGIGPTPMSRLTVGRRVAVVGRLAAEADRRQGELGWDVTVATGLEGFDDIDRVFGLLQDRRDDFDILLAAAGIPAVVLAVRVAHELERVAIDFGHSLNYLLNPNFSEKTLINKKYRYRLENYLTGRDDDRPGSPLDGSFCRSERGVVFYVESGRKRHVRSQRLLDALSAKVVNVSGTDLSQLDDSVPLALAYDELLGVFLVKDGTRIPVELGVPVIDTTGLDLGGLPVSPIPLEFAPVKRLSEDTPATDQGGALSTPHLERNARGKVRLVMTSAYYRVRTPKTLETLSALMETIDGPRE